MEKSCYLCRSSRTKYCGKTFENLPDSSLSQRTQTGTISAFYPVMLSFSLSDLFFKTDPSFYIFLISSLSCFLPSFSNPNPTVLSKGGQKSFNSSSWLPCYQWPAHLFLPWPPGSTAQTKVCVCVFFDLHVSLDYSIQLKSLPFMYYC